MMNWNEILKESNLLYASEKRDYEFRKLKLREQLYTVRYYKTYPLTPLDSVIIETLKFNGGELNDLDFAQVLGFNVVDDFEQKRYKDFAEKEIFDEIIKEVSKFALVSTHEHTIRLMPLGYRAIADKVKYEFYVGYKPLMEFFDLEPRSSETNKIFPFYDALGLETPLQESSKIDFHEYNDIEKLDAVLNAKSKLIDCFNLQSSVCPHIFEAEKTDGYFVQETRLHEVSIDFRIYQYNELVYPVVYYNDSPCEKLNSILWNGDNESYLQEKRLLGMYHYVVRKTKLPLNLQNLKPYYSYWQIDELISNDRYVWSDENLFELVQELCSGNDWTQMSKRCPLENLYEYIPKYREMWEWTILSHRCDDNYIIEHILLYPWDFALLSSEREIEFIKPLIVRPELAEKDWDWEEIVPKLDIPFIIHNLSVLDIDLMQITPKVLESYPQVILDYPEKKWDWKYVSTDAPLQFILTNLYIFGTNLSLEDVIDRAFRDESLALQYCQSKDFIKIIDNLELKYSYCANQKDYVWSIALIDWLEARQLIRWGSTPNIVGLECNPYLVWNTELFEQYKGREFSPEGWKQISINITNTQVILKNIDLTWDWEVLSKRDIVINDYEFIAATHNKLNLNTLLPILNEDIISHLYEDGVLIEHMEDPELRAAITASVPRGTIVKHLADNWDWGILTHRFCSTLNIENFGKPQWVDKWDWKYLSEHFDCDIVKEKVNLYVDYWDWTIISQRLGHDFIISNLPEYAKYWDWNVVINDVLEPEDLLMNRYLPMIATCVNTQDEELRKDIWADITKKLSTDDVVQMISRPLDRSAFQFNYINIYNRRDFDIINYLETCESNRRIYIDWSALSRSNALNAQLTWDKKIVKEYKIWVTNVLNLLTDGNYAWDFKYLSQQSSINWCDTILKTRTSEWDWDYICEHSSLFHASKNLVKHIQDFADYINFDILSKREDLNLKSEDFEKVAEYPWTWSKLSNNSGINITSEFIIGHENFDWDWYDVSGRNDFSAPLTYINKHPERNWNWGCISANTNIQFDIDLFLTMQDKQWDWDAISKRKDIEFNEKVVRSLSNHPLNWNYITKRPDFEISINTISCVPIEEVAWDILSCKPDLSFEFIKKYQEYLHWKELTKTTSIDIANAKYLDAFYDYLDWTYVSKSTLFKITKDNLENFKFYLDWKQISRRPDFDISLVDDFEDYIDWSYFSRATQIKLTPEIIEKYAEHWDWIELSQNVNFVEQDLYKYYESKLNIVKFYQHICKAQSTPSIYHFTHMFNAIDIIRSRKILSRNRAQQLGLLKYDAAGAVVNRTSKAHPYARFYFRTGTQTQFYNECLGKQVGTNYYVRAEKNGLPMCPMPVFFKFDLQEVLMQYGEDCYYSTGNMQSSSAYVKQVVKHPLGLTVETLFSNGHSKEEQEKRQQEFLIPDEFDFSKMKNYQIICYNRTQKEILESMFEGDPICEHFVSVESSLVEDVFLQENPRLEFLLDGEKINISTNYQGEYHFRIVGEDLSAIRVGERKNTIQDGKNRISLKKGVNIEQCGGAFEIYYICDNPKARSKEWLIYKQ